MILFKNDYWLPTRSPFWLNFDFLETYEHVCVHFTLNSAPCICLKSLIKLNIRSLASPHSDPCSWAKYQIFGLYFGLHYLQRSRLINQFSKVLELFYIGVLSLNFNFSKHLCSKNSILAFMAFISYKGQVKITYF